MFADQLPNVEALALDDSYVYVSAGTNVKNAVSRYPKSGGAPTTLTTGFADAIATDASHVYWALYDNWGSVHRVAKSGGNDSVIADKQPRVSELAVHGSSLFWLATGSLGMEYADGAIVKGAGAPVVLASKITRLTQMAVTDTTIFFTHFTKTTGPAAALETLPIGGGTPTLRVDGDVLVAVTVDATHVYWSAAPKGAFNPSEIYRAPLGGGTPVLLGSGKSVVRLWVEGPCLYLRDNGRVGRLPKAGGSISWFDAVGSAQKGRFAVDAASVYWLDTSGGRVLRQAL